MHAGLVLLVALAAAPAGMVAIPAGTYSPPAQRAAEGGEPISVPPVKVAAFLLDRLPVTNAELLGFVREHPEWRRSRVPRVFADEGYLRGWKGDLALASPAAARAPATEVSWFAAKAYCAAQGKRLPTVDEWEYAASEPPKEAKATAAVLLAWYARPTPKVLPAVGRQPPNRFGVRDLHGLVWEWALDFSAAVEDGRFTCSSAGARAVDETDYATFMRYSLRASLRASYSVRNVGFRCARSLTGSASAP